MLHYIVLYKFNVDVDIALFAVTRCAGFEDEIHQLFNEVSECTVSGLN